MSDCERKARKEGKAPGKERMLWEDGEPMPADAQLYTKDIQDNEV